MTVRCEYCLLPVDNLRDRPSEVRDNSTVFFCDEKCRDAWHESQDRLSTLKYHPTS